MKKLIVILVTVLLMAGLWACAPASTASTPEAKKLNIICTIFPEYDWVRQILGDKAKDVDLTLLLDNGVDLHSYQPTAEDIVNIANCDLFIYVGGESDGWVDHALAEAVNKNMIVLNLMDILGETVKEEEVVEGMQAEEHEHDESEEHESAEAEEHEHEEEVEYDEHVWLSLKNASVICNKISDALSQLDADNAEAYNANKQAYTASLTALDGEYTAMVSTAARKTVLFADRFPFRYLVDDYGLDYYAAFVGCSAETEASFETVVFLAGKTDELGLPAVLVIENSDQKIAQTVVSNTTAKNQPILVMDSMQSVTSGDVADGETYLKIMQSNLEVLHQALN